MSTASVISVRNLVKRFGTKTVVDHVTMDVAEGEIVGFLGSERFRQDHHHPHHVRAADAR